MTDIAKLLKDCPTGTKLYSPLFGEVEFAEVMDTDYMSIRVMKRGYGLRFDKYGRYMGNEYPDAECLLFPSKYCRTWDGWKTSVEPKFKVGDWVVKKDGKTFYGGNYAEQITLIEVDEKGKRIWLSSTTYVHDDDIRLWTIQDAKDGDVLMSDKGNPFIFCEDRIHAWYHNIIAYCGITTMGSFCESSRKECWTYGTSLKPATKEQRDLLFSKMKEAGYEWDENKNEVRKIKPHYDITNFHAGMPVLVRDYDNSRWSYVQFSHYVGEECGFKFNACGIPYIQCIPFNDDTKHLLGTTDMPSEEYINW